MIDLEMYEKEEIDAIISALRNIGLSITPNGFPGHDAAGGTVASLTEAVMGITAGLYAVAEAIREHGES